MAILEVKNLKKSYKKGFIPKKEEVLKGVSFSIKQGTITGFLGGNGAGKTTTMKCLLELAFPDEGEISYFDGQPISSEVKKKIGFLPERPYFYEYLTGYEFLRFYGELSTELKKKDLRQRITTLLKKVDLYFAKDRLLKQYSKGMLQKIGLAQALVHSPEFVILDEPMSGLDPDGRYYLRELILQTSKEGASVFFSSHLLHDAELICKDLVILKSGQVIYEGSTQNLLKGVVKNVEIVYEKNGVRQNFTCEKGGVLQEKIDELRKEGFDILSVKAEKASLEKAFISMALRGEKDSK